MVRNKWIIGVRNTLLSLKGECDSCAAIEGARLSKAERESLQKLLNNVITYIENNLP